jgi:hypothetical protein
MGANSPTDHPMKSIHSAGKGSRALRGHPRRWTEKRGALVVSYRARERKRRVRAAVARSKRQNRSVIAARYFLTVVKRACRCAGCGARLVEGGEMVYRHDGRVTLCVGCAERDPLVEFRPSVRWERRRAPARREERWVCARCGGPHPAGLCPGGGSGGLRPC